jgi:hypothetical protein
MAFNATFNNISAIAWRSVLLVDKTTILPQVTEKLYHIMLFRVLGIRTHNVSMINDLLILVFKVTVTSGAVLVVIMIVGFITTYAISV